MPDGFFLTPDYKARIDALLRRGAGGFVPPQDLGSVNYDIVPYKCSAAVPAHGVMRVTGVTLDTDNQPRLDTAQPNSTLQRFCLVNLPQDGEDGGDGFYYGAGTWLTNALHVLYDSNDGTPANGEGWGPKAGQWSLAKWRCGFQISGGRVGTGSEARVIAHQTTVHEVYCQTNAAIAKGGTGAVTIYDGVDASTLMTLTGVKNKFASLAISKKAIARWFGGSWYLTAGECA